MMEFIKKNRTVLLTVFAVLSLSLNIYFLTDSRIKSDIIHGLEQTNGFFDNRLKESRDNEQSYLIAAGAVIGGAVTYYILKRK